MDSHHAPRSGSYQPRALRRGGTTIDIVAVIVLLGLVGLGVWWVIKTMGKAGQQYTTAVVNARNEATGMGCQMNMRSVWQVLQANVAAEGTYPETRQELGNLCGDSRLLRCPDPNGAEYVYLPPKRVDSATPQVVLYEPKAVHKGRCSVLLSDGRLGFLRPEEIKAALGQGPQRRR